MTSNIGQTLMGGGGGMLPSLAQDIAGGNFHDNRESFHDYIYSKLILGEDKDGSGSNNPVFPPTGLPNYASSMGPALPARTAAVAFNNQNQNLSGMGPQPVSSNNIQPTSESAIDMNNGTIPSTPQVSTLKPSNSKKTLGPKSHHKNQLSNVTQINVPNHEGLMAISKPKKNKSPKKKEKNNFCDVCGRGFAEKYTLNRHMLTHTHVKPYSCTKCNMAFSRSDGLAKHMNAGHRRIDAHHCDVCGGTFNSELSFEQHKREYGTTLPFVCNLCMLAFSQCCHLNYHMKSHSLKSDYGVEVSESTVDPVLIDDLIPDDFCQPKSKEPSNKIGSINFSALNASLNPDIRIKHEIDDNYPYSKPGEVLQENQEKKNAENAHPSLSNVPAGSSGDMNTNMISDIDMKKYYDIKIPNPRFLESSNTNTNTDGSQPTEVTLFRCHICGKGFTRKYHMQRHVRLHTRGPIPRAHVLDWTRRPYACGVCKMGFTRQHHLTRHMLIHTGERPHSCHICGKAFRRYTNLSLHVRTVHGSERPFKCPICGRGFPRVYSLQRHLNTHGKNNDANLLMKAGLMPLPRKDEENADSKNENSSPDYIAVGTKIINSGHVGGGNNDMHGRNDMPADALLSDGSDEEVVHPVIDRERQMEIDRINASIESTIGDVIKGVMAQGKPTKPKGKKASAPLSTPTTQPSLNPGVNNAMQSDQLVPLSLQQQHNEALQQQQQQQHQQQHQQQQQQRNQQQQHHQQSQQQHSRHPSISQDSDQFSAQSSIMSNAMTRHDMAPPRSGFNDLSMRSPTPYSQQQHQQQQQQPQHHQQTNGDSSTTSFSLNQHQQQQQQQQQQPNDVRPPSSYSMHHTQTDKPGTPYTLNQNTMSRERPGSAFSLNTGQNISDRSSTPYSHSQQPTIDRSSTPFMLNQPSNFDAFTGSTSSRSQNQQIVAPLDRSESREPILYSHSANGFQIPLGTMDLSTPRNRLGDPNIRQAPTDFGHNLTMSQAALNEAAAFAHVQATNNLSLFPGNATLTYHQQQLMGEALSRLDMELQVAHQGSGQLPTTSHNNNRPY